jgi:alpha-ketoglutarate-dependent taurine dioxygenase
MPALDTHLAFRAIESPELTVAPSMPPFLHVAQPQRASHTWNFKNWLEHFKASRHDIKNRLQTQGAILFRGLPISEPKQFEELLLALDIQLNTQYFGGASPRSKLSQYTFSSTEAPAPLIISYHTEMCYLNVRPGVVAFYCDIMPSVHGETPIFNCHALYNSLSPQLKEKLSGNVKYQRYFRSQPSRLNFNKTWQDAFNLTSKDELKNLLHEHNIDFSWDKQGNLLTETTMPAVIRHPATGKLCLSLTMFNQYSLTYNLRHFKTRYNPILRVLIDRLMLFQYERPNVFFRTVLGDGSPFTKEDTEEILAASWKCATLFSWRKGDVLLLDNILMGHGRLNVKGPRKIVAALGDNYDIRTLGITAEEGRRG